MREYKELEIRHIESLAQEGISYWETVIENYYELSREEATKQLIEAKKIHQKIQSIKKIIQKASAFYE